MRLQFVFTLKRKAMQNNIIEYFTEYRGYFIKEVFRYHLGKSDFEVWQDVDSAILYPRTCMEDIKNEIDSKLSDI